MISGKGFELSDLNPFNYEACIGDYCTDLGTIGETAFYDVPKAVLVDAPIAVAEGLVTSITTTADFFETVASRDFWNYYIEDSSRIAAAYSELSLGGKILAAVPAALGALLAVFTAPVTAAATAATGLGVLIFGGCGGSGIGNDWEDPVNFHGYRSVAECRQDRHMTSSMHELAPIDYDSDGDGISDNEEDLDRDCECDPMETCWYWPDTDGDGIADGAGIEKNCITEEDVLGPDFELPIACPAGSRYDMDGDGFANAVDPDADNDGRMDFEEDRNINYIRDAGDTIPTAGILYYFRGVFSSYPVSYIDDFGVTYDSVTCDLEAMARIGVRYALYVIHYESDGMTVRGEPQRLGSGASLEDGGNVELLVCKNELLASDANFNGLYDVFNLETNMENVDTDGDGWCDGDNFPVPAGVGMCHTATTYMGENDACPTVFDPTNVCDTER